MRFQLPKVPNIKQEINDFRLVLPQMDSSVAPPGVRTNTDTDPVPASKRTWGKGTWIMYWCSDIITVSGWQKAASMIALGLDWRQALIVTTVGSILLTIPMVLNGKIGSVLHIPFPIAIRASHGYHFAKFPVVSRIITAWLWFGVQSWNGGAALKLMIGAIWPSFKTLPNHVPASAGFTTQSMVAYFLYWLLQLPFLFIHPTKLRHVFFVKSVAVPITGLATMAWCIAKAGGGGEMFKAGPTVHGSDFSSAWLLSMTSLIGGYSTVALNIPDFTRYSKDPISQYVQAPVLPVLYLITALFGIVAASATKSFNNGVVLWSPLDIAALWDSRAAVFFASSAWCLAQISCNVSANSIAAANDLATLFPKYINIRRGQIITALLGGWAMAPFKILSSAKVFLNFISGYAIVLGPFAGIMCADFYLVKRQFIDVPALYDPRGVYRFHGGFNWRCVATLILTVTPNLPGLINVMNPKIHIGNIKWVYSVSWLFGFILSIIIYTGLSWAFPDTTGSLVDHTTLAEDYLAEKGVQSSPSGEDLDEKLEGDAYAVPASKV
ncbi:NCS1 nucleoside transporter family [Leucosporidium creatinivorum]|uniref:NCS1 nucleoside transporter family n=1 Tax=Leucosporidium creatinivorum TaxID=106004 RepID=A0A1Y2DM63_9BASI|nr:NCS1 nucleoside transporter family [Leucosporidium creatinivorum]